ncbi:hypothetical protein RsoM2USA_476 [Ralstonia phage RsoM2USA]|nr:hypothetical protein RsoM2USA_476 [Ralstonia phage RsoM2USA]
MITINQIFKDVLTTSRHVKDNYPFEAKLAKLTEEHGEFSTAIQIERGHLPHKTASESSFGEAADMMIVILDVLRSHHSDLDDESIIEEIMVQLGLKNNKWRRVIERNYAAEVASQLPDNIQ